MINWIEISSTLQIGNLSLEYYLNGLSLHGQFNSVADAENAIAAIMRCRRHLFNNGQQLYIDRPLMNAKVTGLLSLREVVAKFGHDRKRAILRWLDRDGPHWDSEALHSPDSYFVSYVNQVEEVVTDSVIAETAYLNHLEISSALVSVAPSRWCSDPIEVALLDDQAQVSSAVKVRNYWQPEKLKTSLERAPTRVTSWQEVGEVAQSRFVELRFTSGWLRSANRHPFDSAVASASLRLLDILHQLRRQIVAHGRNDARTVDYFARHFRGDSAPFSDSSEDEKHRFQSALTFVNPDVPDDVLFCPWHGKIRRLAWRLHFSAPLSSDSPLYVVYLGPKLTTR